MLSKKLKLILLLTLVLIYLHGLEEFLSGFPFNDPWMVFFGNLFETKTQVFYWAFHIMWWILVPVGIILLMGGKKLIYILLMLFGVIYVTELHHVIKSISAGHYYPGMITGLMYPILGFFYWKELIKNWRKNYGRN